MTKLLILIFSLTVLFACMPHGQMKTKKPNIIWLMAEDISLDLECYGMQAVQTPNLNKLAAQGVRFDNCFVTSPICSPSRSAMMIGTHQVKTNTHHHRSNREVPLDSQFKPLTYWLRKSGYTTILGHHGVFSQGRKIDVNFKHEPLGEWDGIKKFGIFDKYDHFETEDEPFLAQIQLKVTHRGDWWDEIREKSEHPVNPNEVELPKFMSDHPTIRLDWAKYLDQMEYMDHEVGMILKELEEKGMADNTIIIFIGDNGRCNIRGKGYLHDPGLHIPLIIYDPRKEGGQVNKQVVSATDITATILDYAGIEIPDYMTGRPIFGGKFDREYVYGARDLWDEVMEQSRAITSGKWKYIRNDKPEVPFDAGQAYLEFYRPAVHVMRQLNIEGKLSSEELLFFQSTKPREELYNLEDDPQELKNLALVPKYQSTLKKMRKFIGEVEYELSPVASTFEPVYPMAVDVLAWLKKERPKEYASMLSGVEIGFKRMTMEYKKQLKTNKK